MKPISTVPRALDTIDVTTGEAAKAIHQRSDVCAAVPAGPVSEAMVARVLAEAVLEKFGGDSVAETRRSSEGNWPPFPRLRADWSQTYFGRCGRSGGSHHWITPCGHAGRG